MLGGSPFAVLITVFAMATFADTRGLESKEDLVLRDTTKGPVAKVLKILEDIKKQLVTDAQTDADVDESMQCWCKANIAGKTKAIEDNTEKKGQLENEIEELRSKSQELNTQIASLDEEVKNNEKTLDTAIAIRKKDLAEFTDAETSAMTTIKQLAGAEATLATRQKAMLQDDVVLDAGSTVGVALTHGFRQKEELLWELHDKEARRIMKDLLKKSRDINFIQGGSGGKSLRAPSDMIYGVIRQMKETFQSELSKMQSQELDDSAHHAAMKKEKNGEIKAGVDMIDLKTGELADTDERAAAARIELDDTETALANDQEFLEKVKEQCAFHDEEYAKRLETRQTEETAVNKAVAILSDDEAKNLFTKSLGHTRRGEKLGSRGLKEFKEERETESMRSQTNKARKAQWGTSERYLLNQEAMFLQVSSQQDTIPEADKLSALAARTQSYWKSKYYLDAQAANHSAIRKAHLKTEAQPKGAKAEPEGRNKLGLTASQMAMRKGGMGGVTDGVLKMRHALEFQQGEEKLRKTWCVDEIQQVEKDLDNSNRKKKDIEEKIELMAQRMERLRYEIKILGHEQEDADIELQKASIDRKKANTEFQQSVMNQLETKKVLGTAMAVLESVWGTKKKKAALLREKTRRTNRFTDVMGTIKRVAQLANGVPEEDPLSFQDAKRQEMKSQRPSAALLQSQKPPRDDFPTFMKSVAPHGNVAKILNAASQEASAAEALIKKAEAMAHTHKAVPAKALMQQEPAGPPPPPGLKKYSNAAAGGGVVTMLENLQEDAQAMVDEAVKGETEALKAYEVVVAEANKATEIRQEDITNRRMEVGKLEEFTQESKIALSEEKHLIATLRQHDIDLYGVEGCAYLIKNYVTRYMEREEEIESLKETEAILGVSGGDPKMSAAAHAGDAPLAEPTEAPEPVEEEEPEEEKKGESTAKVVPEGVKIEGPNGETAISKTLGAK